MALTIEGATIGFDAGQISTALNKLRQEVIDDSIATMRKQEGEIAKNIGDWWVGQSANQFMNNLRSDRMRVESALNAAKTILSNELYNIANRMSELDENLVKSRDGGIGGLF